MRIAVTGGTGNVGSALVHALAREPGLAGVVAVARRGPEQLPDGVEFRAADLGGELPVDLLAGVDAVVHLAWLFQPSHAPAITWEANAGGTVRLLEQVVAHRVRTVVHASSVGAYSPRTDDVPVDESWPTHGVPGAQYSAEKAYVERLLDLFEAEHPDVRVVRLRPAFIFRQEASVQQRRLFMGPFAPATLVARTGLPLVPDPGFRLQTVHTADVVEAYRLAVLGEASGAFNVAGDPLLRVPDIARHLGARTVRVPARALRAAVRVAWAAHLVPASPGMVDLAAGIPVLDSTRARRELGWAPRFDAHEAVAALLAGLRTPAGGTTPPLAPRTSGPLRSHELATGVGERP